MTSFLSSIFNRVYLNVFVDHEHRVVFWFISHVWRGPKSITSKMLNWIVLDMVARLLEELPHSGTEEMLEILCGGVLSTTTKRR